MTFETSLPDLGTDDDPDDDCRETANELKFLDQHFTRQIYFLFSMLKAVETFLGNVNGPSKLTSQYTHRREK